MLLLLCPTRVTEKERECKDQNCSYFRVAECTLGPPSQSLNYRIELEHKHTHTHIYIHTHTDTQTQLRPVREANTTAETAANKRSEQGEGEKNEATDALNTLVLQGTELKREREREREREKQRKEKERN